MTATVRARSRIGFWIARFLVIAGLFAMFALDRWWVPGLGLVAGAMVVTLGIVLAAAAPAPRRGELTVDDRGLSLDGEVVVPRSAIPARAACELVGPKRALLATRAGRVDIALEGPHAFDVCFALGAAPGFSSLRDASLARNLAVVGGVLYVVGVACLHLVGAKGFLAEVPLVIAAMLVLPVALVTWFVARAALLRAVEVGAEGFVVRGFRHEQHVSYADVTEASAAGNRVTVRLHDRRELAFDMGDVWSTATDEETRHLRARELARRLQAGQRAFEQPTRAVVAQLTRGNRDARAWLDGLASQGGAHAAFRTAALTAERLWSILEDPTQPPDVRAGAAVALRSDLDDAGRQRLRAVAHASIAPRFRVCLETVADGDDDALPNALDAMNETASGPTYIHRV